MKLSTHFTLEEFVSSDTAARLGIDNDLPAELYGAAKATAEMLEAIRAHLSDATARPLPVIITSGYRCPALNTAIGSKPSSDHVRACAADIKVPLFGSPYQVASALAPFVSTLGIGQLILEYATPEGGGWTHVSTRVPDKIINRIITINKDGTFPGIVD